MISAAFQGQSSPAQPFVWSGSRARLSKSGTGSLGTGLYETFACRFSRYEGSNTDRVDHVDSSEQKKGRDGYYMNARYGGFPQGTVVD